MMGFRKSKMLKLSYDFVRQAWIQAAVWDRMRFFNLDFCPRVSLLNFTAHRFFLSELSGGSTVSDFQTDIKEILSSKYKESSAKIFNPYDLVG
jgi:hypothetical protein